MMINKHFVNRLNGYGNPQINPKVLSYNEIMAEKNNFINMNKTETLKTQIFPIYPFQKNLTITQ